LLLEQLQHPAQVTFLPRDLLQLSGVGPIIPF